MLWEDAIFATSAGPTDGETGRSEIAAISVDKDDIIIRSLPLRCKVSAAAGLSMAALMFGLSLFLPTKLRSRWYQYDSW